MRRIAFVVGGLGLFLSAGLAPAQDDCTGFTWDMEATIQEVQLGFVPENTIVKFENSVVVTGLRNNGFWVQELGATGTPFSGIFVYNQQEPTLWEPGDLVNVIGEYIEDEDDFKLANELGCRLAQGNYFGAGAPLPHPGDD